MKFQSGRVGGFVRDGMIGGTGTSGIMDGIARIDALS